MIPWGSSEPSSPARCAIVTAGRPFAHVGGSRIPASRRRRRRSRGKARDPGAPTQRGCGRHPQLASSRSSATSPSMSACPNTSTYRLQQLALGRIRRRTCAVREGAASIVARARCSALLTDATVDSRSSATSGRGPAEHVAEDQDRALATGQLLDRAQQRQLHPLAHRVARRRVISRRGRLVRRPVGNGSIGSGRRGRRSISSRHALVAIRYSQV